MKSPFDRFTEVVSANPDVVYLGYRHIDNGGFFLEVDKFSNISISFSFHGYSNTVITMNNLMIDELIDALKAAKVRFEESQVVSKLKGE